MDYPGGYNVPAFPAGPSIAVSRLMAICALVLAVLIVFTCGIILWANSSRTIDQFIISIDPLTGGWEIVGHSHNQNEYTAPEFAQIATLNTFVRDWFLVSPDENENQARWSSCHKDYCEDGQSTVFGQFECSLYCQTSKALFEQFTEHVVPEYKYQAQNGEFWAVDANSIRITPIDVPTVDGGTWRIDANVISTVQDFKILAYAKTERRILNTDMILTGRYPVNYIQTMGFFVTQFNAYRID